jgi:hypothetical protein
MIIELRSMTGVIELIRQVVHTEVDLASPTKGGSVSDIVGCQLDDVVEGGVF